jgi:Arc/MetJ-type ribon-helix-helix transcriptional regulator
MYMNVNLGAPYERIIKKVIARGYAGNQTEVIRQALLDLDRKMEEEEVRLVNKGIEAARKKIKENKEELKPMEQVFKECGL